MLAKLGEVHAGVAVHAVAHVNAQATPQAAQVAEGTVVDAAPLLVIVQMADVAVVAAPAASDSDGSQLHNSNSMDSVPLRQHGTGLAPQHWGAPPWFVAKHDLNTVICTMDNSLLTRMVQLRCADNSVQMPCSAS